VTLAGDVWFLSPQRENIFHSKKILELFINGIDWYLFDDVQFYFRPIETSLCGYKKHAMQKQTICEEGHPICFKTLLKVAL